MPEPSTYDYAVIRVVPRPEREEFINVGVVVSCPQKDFLEARIELDENRLDCLDSTADVDAIRRHLATIVAICEGGEDAGPIGRLSKRERFHWLVAPRSTVIQMSDPHSGRCTDPEGLVEHLLDKMVRPPRRVESHTKYTE